MLNQVNIIGVNVGVYAQNRAQVNVANSTISGNTIVVLATYNTSVIRLSNTGIGKGLPLNILSAQ